MKNQAIIPIEPSKHSSKLPLIIRIHYYTPTSPKRTTANGKVIDPYEFYSNGTDWEEYVTNKSKHPSDSKELQFNYEDYQKGVTKNVEYQKDCKQFNQFGEINKFNPSNTKAKRGTIVWDALISLAPATSAKNDLSALAVEAATITYRNLLIANAKRGWTDHNTDWVASVHKDKAHHHIHLKIFQPEKINNDEIISKPMVSMRFKGPAIVQISKSLFGLKQDATAISKARDILRKEFENYILSVMNDNYGDELREAALDATRLNAISKQIEEVRKDFKKFGLAINYGNLVKPVDERIFYYQKLKPENYDNNLSNYSKANVKLLKHMLPNVTHIKTEYEWSLLHCKPDKDTKPLIVYVPVYVDQSGLSPKQRIDAEQKFIKLQGIYEFERFKEHRKVDHYERTKVYDVTQVVKLSSKSKENPTVLKSQFELKCLVDDFIENTIKNNPKLNKFNQTFFNEVEKHFKQIQGALDPDVKTKYIPETINKQKEFRLNEMHTALANKVLKLADATNKIKKTYGNSHSIGQACKNLTAELKTFMSKTFKNHFENEFHYVYAALDNDVKAALKNDQQHDLGWE